MSKILEKLIREKKVNQLTTTDPDGRVWLWGYRRKSKDSRKIGEVYRLDQQLLIFDPQAAADAEFMKNRRTWVGRWRIVKNIFQNSIDRIKSLLNKPHAH